MLSSRNRRRASIRKRPLKMKGLESRAMLTVVPAGFIETQVGGRLETPPVSLLQTPDGRLLVTAEKDDLGSIFVVKNGSILPTPAIQIELVSEGEFGMVGTVLDPDFEQNGFIYVMYTSNEGGLHNRLSRFQFQGDTIPPQSERLIFEFTRLGAGTVHNGGGMAFGTDGTLFIGVGDNANSAHARTLENQFGKILRINVDGSIPTDNPFYNQATGDNRAIYAIGVRNPYTMDADPATGRIFFNDVGPAGPEEINEVVFGADYAWPLRTGVSNDPAHTNPIYSYRHRDSTPNGCAITGGAFSRPSEGSAPAQVRDKYFFADYCGNWIDALDLNTGVATRFASDVGTGPVSLHADDSGALY